MSTVTCRLCGSVFTRPPRANRQAFCPGSCDREAAKLRERAHGGTCQETECNRTAAYGRRICEAHRNMQRFGRPCVRCGNTTQRNDATHCGACRTLLGAIGKALPVVYRTCRRCQSLYVWRQGRTHCASHLSRNGIAYSYVPKIERWVACKHCGAPVWSRIARRSCDQCKRATSREQRREAKHRRRTRMRAVEPVGLKYLLERDGGRCQLCKRKVDVNKAVPHPLAPTTDHIIPVSLGGTHERRNCQLAHFICNSRKHTGGTDQLRLIG